MLCSVCKKNVAVIFAKKIDGKENEMEGYCYECAKAKGIDPLEFIAKQSGMTPEQMNNLSQQFESIIRRTIR